MRSGLDVAVLGEYQNVALDMADWTVLASECEVYARTAHCLSLPQASFPSARGVPVRPQDEIPGVIQEIGNAFWHLHGI
jgi:hypothetical protein